MEDSERTQTMSTENEKADSSKSFGSLGLADWLSTQCEAVGIRKPKPIQQNCIPHILNGKYLVNKMCDNRRIFGFSIAQ